jgi:hypothetical protein
VRHLCHVRNRIALNRWKWGKTKPLPILLKLLGVMVKEIGDGREANRLRHRATDLLEQYFSASEN